MSDWKVFAWLVEFLTKSKLGLQLQITLLSRELETAQEQIETLARLVTQMGNNYSLLAQKHEADVEEIDRLTRQLEELRSANRVTVEQLTMLIEALQLKLSAHASSDRKSRD